jgi:hypothetical protein
MSRLRRKDAGEPKAKAEDMHGRPMRAQGTSKVKPKFAVVRFNEGKRMFDTGNIKKLVHVEEYMRVAQERIERMTRKPSAEDLDAVAEEERIKWLTSK